MFLIDFKDNVKPFGPASSLQHAKTARPITVQLDVYAIRWPVKLHLDVERRFKSSSERDDLERTASLYLIE